MIGQSAGKSFAYILGVYLGDGSITKWHGKGRSERLLFRLNTIDEDFAQATKTALMDLTDYTVNVWSHPVSKSSKPNWALQLGDRVLCKRLIADTEKKRVIPAYVVGWPHDLRLAFIVGLMDSEGHASLNGKGQCYLGFRNTAPWFMDLIRIFQSVGLVVGKLGIDTLPSGKLYRRITIRNKSWIESGARFNIARKQERIDRWAAAKLTSETSRRTPHIAVMI